MPSGTRQFHRLLPMVSGFRGTLYRACDPAYANEQDLLTGEGASRQGGRWNAPGTFAVVYLSRELEGAIAESLGLPESYGFDPATRLPLTLVAIDATLARVLDLTHPAVRQALGVTLSQMCDCDWRAENAAGRQSLTQALASAAFACGIQGIVVPSATARRLRHLNVFPGNLGGAQALTIRRADRLPPARP